MKVFVILLLVFTFSQAKKRYDGYKVLRIIPKTATQLAYLKWLFEDGIQYELNFWIPPSSVGKPIDVLVNPIFLNDFLNDLKARNIEFSIKTTNLESAIEKEKNTSAVMFDSKPGFKGKQEFNLETYNRYKDIVQYLKELQTKNPTRISLINIGLTHEKRILYVAKISGNNTNSIKPAIWLDGGIHAREWISPATVLHIINKLVTKYDSDDFIKVLVDNIDWYIMPVFNPDGYEYSHSEDRMWRKNRSPRSCERSFLWDNCCQGTDLNRNFNWKWSTIGSSSNPCHDVYHGSKPFSEPETKAVRDFILQRKSQMKGFISLHSYSQLWLMPYGHKKYTYPDDISTDLKPLARAAARKLRELYGTSYDVGTGADLLYEAAGGSLDWAKGKAGIKLALLEIS